MKSFPLVCMLPAFFLAACTFDYSDGSGSAQPPDMRFSDTRAMRFSDGKKSMEISAETLEIYSEEKIWAGEHVEFSEYTENGGENSGEAGMMLLDEKNEVYTLGRGVLFNLPEDDITVSAADLRWSKNERTLSAPENSYAEIRSGEITAKGRGFFADTRDRSYRFTGDVSGEMHTDDAEQEEGGTADSSGTGGVTGPAEGSGE